MAAAAAAAAAAEAAEAAEANAGARADRLVVRRTQRRWLLATRWQRRRRGLGRAQVHAPDPCLHTSHGRPQALSWSAQDRGGRRAARGRSPPPRETGLPPLQRPTRGALPARVRARRARVRCAPEEPGGAMIDVPPGPTTVTATRVSDAANVGLAKDSRPARIHDPRRDRAATLSVGEPSTAFWERRLSALDPK